MKSSINWVLPYLRHPVYPSQRQSEYRYGVGRKALKAKKTHS